MTTETKEALLNGASMFIVPIEYDYSEYDYNDSFNVAKTINELHESLPKGIMTDCENFGMTFGCREDCPVFRRGKCEFQYSENLNMTISEYSLYQINQKLTIDNKGIGTIKSVKVVRVNDICGEQYKNIMNTEFIEIIDRFINWYNKQYNNYDQNTYVFLYEVAK